MSLPILNSSRAASYLGRSVTSPLASTSRLTLSSPTHQIIRSSHIGATPLYIDPNITLTIQPFPPHANPGKPLPPALQDAQSLLVKGPLGECRLPLHKGVTVTRAASSASTPADEEETVRYDVSIGKTRLSRPAKKLVALWGLTRALLQNAADGVIEGHSLALKLVGVGYRAAVEVDPTPPPSKLRKALMDGQRTYFTSKEQEEAYRALAELETPSADGPQRQRLVLKLGYSHPISMPVPRELTVATPLPTRIVIKGVDKEAVGLFASKVRAWRPPEPYKGKGIFVGDETIKLKTPKKK